MTPGKPDQLYFTVDELAKRWECKNGDVLYLLDCGELRSSPVVAARQGKMDIKVVACDKATDELKRELEQQYPNDLIFLSEIKPNGTREEAELRVIYALQESGDMDYVVLGDEVIRFELANPD